MRATLLPATLLAALALSACDDPTEPAELAPEQLLLVRFTDPSRVSQYFDSLDIYRVNADGTGLQNLTAHPAGYGGLSPSPDGRRVAFHSNRGGSVLDYVWVMNTDGTGLQRLTSKASVTPKWSPDGTRIAVLRDGADSHVWVMNADGANPLKVSGPAMQVGTPCAANAEVQNRIDLVGWIGDERIGFSRYYCGYGYRYFIVNADGTGFTETTLRLWDAFWSPDGSKVVFPRHQGGYWRVILMNADGTGERVLSTQGTHQGLSARSSHNPWSPDGTRIVFFAETTTEQVASPGACSETALPYVVNVDGTGVRRLMDSCRGMFNGWSRSGDKLAFTLRPGSDSPDVWVVNADGTGAVNVSNGPFWESDAIWLAGRCPGCRG